MWNGIKALTEYKTATLLPRDDDKLPDVLNQFFVHFDTQRGEPAPLSRPPAGESILVLQCHQLLPCLRVGPALSMVYRAPVAPRVLNRRRPDRLRHRNGPICSCASSPFT
ncbi:hypothetical protein AAFF_G00206430 [Aldrovandia affinis]|uniref:Uncharacterized protein n=1 Tax=Aldrovandia affinis TaxID=143900 RepID=A0AAD7RHC0_9TELE|nr:hypothetical protein AAFF_G00206430 [Aldrovandia affinis]